MDILAEQSCKPDRDKLLDPLKSVLVSTIRRSALLFAAITFIFGAVLTSAVALGSMGSSTSGQANNVQTPPPTNLLSPLCRSARRESNARLRLP